MAGVINLETGEIEELDADAIAQRGLDSAGAASIDGRTDAQPEPIQTQVIDVEGDGGLVQIDDASLNQLAAESAVEDEPGTAVGNFIRNIPGSDFIQPILSVASGMVAEPVAGLEGMVRAPFQGALEAANVVKERRDQLTFDTTSPGGQQMLRLLGVLVEQGVDLATLPIEGLQGLATAIGTGDPLLAAADIDAINEKGLSQFLGDEMLGATGSEVVAAGTTALPTALASLFGVKKVPRQPTMQGADDVVNAGQRAGIDVLTSDVSPPITAVGNLSRQLAERIPFVGTGGPRGQQRQQRIDAIQALEDATPDVQAADIFDSLQRNAQKEKRAAGKVLERMRAKMNEPLSDAFKQNLNVAMKERDRMIQESLTGPDLTPQQREFIAKTDAAQARATRRLTGPGTDNSLPAVEKAIEFLNKPGKIKDKNLIATMEEIAAELDDASATFDSLRDFRTDFRTKIVEKVDEAGRSQLSSGEKVQMDNIIRGITKDLDEYAKAELSPEDFAAYKAADKQYAAEARKLTKSRLKSVLDRGDVQPELVENLLFSNRRSENKLLYDKLDGAGRENARNALLGRALKNSTVKGEISPERFLTQLDKLEQNFDVFFKGDRGQELQGLRKVLQATRRADAAGIVTPTGQQLLAPLGLMMTGASFFSPAMATATGAAATVGGISRLYESSLVRNRLIRAANANEQELISIARELPVLMEAAMGEAGQPETQQFEDASP